MKQSFTLLEEHLASTQALQEAATDDFFYTRLKARMERQEERERWRFPLKPVWIIGALTILLTVNGFMLSQQFKARSTTSSTGASSLQNFAAAYDQSLSSSY